MLFYLIIMGVYALSTVDEEDQARTYGIAYGMGFGYLIYVLAWANGMFLHKPGFNTKNPPYAFGLNTRGPLVCVYDFMGSPCGFEDQTALYSEIFFMCSNH